LSHRLDELTDATSGFDSWSDADKIRFFGWYIQTQLNKERFGTSDIRQCFEGLHLALPANISSTLKKMASSRHPQVLEDSRGYRLEKKTLDALNRQFKPARSNNTTFPAPAFASLVAEEELARILEARWNEAHSTLKAGAYLSTIILLGSILEGLLLAKIKANPRDANVSASSPKNSTGKVLHFKDWTLDDLIRVCHECDWLDEDVRDFSSTLRGYRNLVHPNHQLTEGIYPSESTCRISWEVVNAAIIHISR
jgi:hypothetical protein